MDTTNNLYNIKAINLKENQEFYIITDQEKSKYQVITRPVLNKGYVVFKAKDELDNEKKLKFLPNDDTKIFISKSKQQKIIKNKRK